MRIHDAPGAFGLVHCGIADAEASRGFAVTIRRVPHLYTVSTYGIKSVI
jgi:hypothetical protein